MKDTSTVGYGTLCIVFIKKRASIHDSHLYLSDIDENREDETSTVWLCSHCHKAFDSKKRGALTP